MWICSYSMCVCMCSSVCVIIWNAFNLPKLDEKKGKNESIPYNRMFSYQKHHNQIERTKIFGLPISDCNIK